MSLSPQQYIVVHHLNATGSITGVEAESIHKIRHLPSRIFELKAKGYPIAAHTHHDVTGQRYVRYSMRHNAKAI
jgi:hypothetical protein